MIYNEFEFEENTFGVNIKVKPVYSPDLSQPEKGQYVFIYKIQITNNNNYLIKLHSREWSITELDGISHHISGEGVVGLKPIIKPAEGFEYASQAILFQKSGIMYGKYFFTNLEDDSEFYANIPPFNLSVPAYEELEN